MGNLLDWWDGLDQPEQEAYLRSDAIRPGSTPRSFREALEAAEAYHAESESRLMDRADADWRRLPGEKKREAIDKMNEIADQSPLPSRARILALTADLMRPDAERGWKVRGDRQVQAGKRSRKGPRAEVLVAEVSALRRKFPKMSKAEACARIGKNHGISRRTVENRIRPLMPPQ